MISGMALTPTVYNEVLMDSEYEITIYPSKTYYMNLEKYRIQGNTDDIEAMPQAIFCILNTERGKYLAYSNNYGVELEECVVDATELAETVGVVEPARLRGDVESEAVPLIGHVRDAPCKT